MPAGGRHQLRPGSPRRDGPADARGGWLLFALGSSLFPAATAVLGTVAVGDVNTDLATLIRTVVVLLLTAAIVTARREWEAPGRLSKYGR